MDMLIIGSEALRLNGIYLDRPKLDVDYIVSQDMADFLKRNNKYVTIKSDRKFWFKGEDGRMSEYEVALPNSSAESILEHQKNNYADLNTLYWLKMSHRFLKNNPHFKKTMSDIHMFRSMEFDKTRPDWYDKREEETYWYSHPSLKQSKKDFFTDTVNYIHDHDSLHETLCVMHVPAYKYYIKDNAEVECCKDKFFQQEEYIRLMGVVEEAMVLSLERSLVFTPRDKWNEMRVFEFALQKVCTSITSGWFREYAWENYYKCLEMFHSLGNNYIKDNYEIGLEDGTVKEFKK